MKKRYYLVPVVLLLLVLLYQRQCTSRKIAEATFHKDPFVELKIVLRAENLPLHYQGETISVACRSAETRRFPEWKHDFVEAGWNIAPQARLRFQGGPITKSIGEWARAAKNSYLVTDEMTVMIPRDTDLWITWNGCRTFTRWDARTDFPQTFVVETNPAHRAYSVEFSDLVAKQNGSASFRVRSSAFRGGQTYTISTDTFGKEWQTTPP